MRKQRRPPPLSQPRPLPLPSLAQLDRDHFGGNLPPVKYFRGDFSSASTKRESLPRRARAAGRVVVGISFSLAYDVIRRDYTSIKRAAKYVSRVDANLVQCLARANIRIIDFVSLERRSTAFL